jgi:hypothetical protein
MRLEHTQGVTSGLGNFRILILAEMTNLRDKLSIADISQNREDNG